MRILKTVVPGFPTGLCCISPADNGHACFDVVLE